jgi:hypothetical protein
MKAKSTSGLLVHTMGKIAIAFICLIFSNKNQSSTTDSHYSQKIMNCIIKLNMTHPSMD